MWVPKQSRDKGEHSPMKDETRDMDETMRKATPRDVGGIRRRTVGATEADESRKRERFKQERRRLGKEQELLNLVDPAAAIVG